MRNLIAILLIEDSFLYGQDIKGEDRFLFKQNQSDCEKTYRVEKRKSTRS